MKLRPLAAGAVLAAVALLGSACGKDDPATPKDPAGSSAAEQGADTAVRDELRAAMEKSSQQTSLKMSMQMAGMTVDAHIDTAAKASHMVTKAGDDGDAMEIEMLTIGPDTYVKYVSGGMAEQMKGKWARVDAASVGQDKPLADGFFDAEAMLKDTVTVTKLAEGKFKVELGAGETPDVGGLFGGLTGGETPDPSASGGPTTLIMTLTADGLVSGFASEGMAPEETVTITFSDYGTPLKAEKPADKDIVEG
ncbi:hypothetical protein [Phytomonospora endophytica]|uniref:Lipoprotein n=1 Tax=Phytomonospora endophytica TaxID=714109 RepID=A0A841FN17_9ACTN|nr:hypothetical protein [Phytomonospora endophytica]MBB6037244.1 hypothetical protein [Phytomonospora endophytica]GIG71256.1 hypothetical protein Pen01_75510 [Phytomonospora endophytica]